MSEAQKNSRKTMRAIMKSLIECSKLGFNDPDYVDISTIEEVLHDIPEHDISDSDRAKFIKQLHDN